MSDFSTPPQDGQGQQPNQVPDYLVWSILETVLCCLPLGIAGIVLSVRANSKAKENDVSGAIADAAQAKKLLKIGLILGIISAIVIIAFYVLVGVAAVTSSDPTTTNIYEPSGQ